MLKVLKKSVYNRVTFLSGNFNFVDRKAYSVNDNLINDLEPTKSFRLFERFTFCVLKESFQKREDPVGSQGGLSIWTVDRLVLLLHRDRPHISSKDLNSVEWTPHFSSCS